MPEGDLHSTMDPEPISNARNSSPDRDEDHHDAMEVDSGLSMAVDTNTNDETEETMTLLPPNQSHDLDPTSSAAPISDSTTPAPASFSREPPAFDEDTERPRQRRRFHVTVEEETDAEIRSGPNADGANVDDETTVLESAPPRMSELSITTPPAVEQQQGPMLDIVQDSSAPVPTNPASSNRGDQSPHLNTIPLPDVPPPPNPNAPPDPVMEAARRLTSAPNATPDQMQADLALLAPYIAAQAMAAAFPMGGQPPPAGGGGGTDTGNTPAEGQEPTPNEGNNGAPPPLPPFPFLPPFLFGGNSELPADPKRAERLANGLKIAEDGLLKRWKTVCGDEGAVCAVCYSELLEEPGIEKEKDEEKEKIEGGLEAKEQTDEDAHERALRDALKRREEMERLEKEEKERILETAVLAFPCGHVFHRTCLLPWLSRHTTCPTCRFDIDPKSDTLNLPADESMPFPMGPGGFNFREFFTVGPVLRVPRAQAPGGPTPRTRNNQNNAQDQTEPNGAPGSDTEPARNAAGGRANNNDPPSMTEMFEALFGPLLHSVGIPPPRQPSAARAGQAEGARPVPTSIPPATESDDDEPPPLITDPPATSAPSTSNPVPQIPTNPPPVSPPVRRPAPSRPSEARRPPVEDRDRPVAMFGRLTPRRPPQPITPSWMRPARPAPAPAVATTGPSPASTSTAPEPSSIASSSTPAETSVPPTPASTQSSESSRHGLGQLRAIVSNLLPRRISTSGRTSGAPSIRSARSTASTASASTTRNTSQSNQGPLSPRSGIRAILHGPTSLLRDLTSGRRLGSGNRSRASTSSATMPSLESESEDDTTFSEDGIESDFDDDMPALEPIEGRQPRVPTPAPAQIDASEDNNTSAHENQPEEGANEPSQPGGRAAGQDMMDNIITLRIDLGHADGRDETIIVPLLFNPGGRTGTNGQPADAPPAPQQAPAPPPARLRTPPPQKKWTPPEAVKTFRQVVEEKEREAGWRCDDPACLLGPADDEELSDEPHPIKLRYPIMRSIAPEGLVRYQKNQDGIRVYADGEDVRVSGENPVCEHTLHAECLVTSARVNGWSPPHNADPHSRVTLRCPVCRHEGNVERQVWDAGMEAEAVELN